MCPNLDHCELYPIIVDAAVDRADVANIITDGAKYGVLIDTGSSGFLLNRPNFLNIQTIMSALDEAPKSKKKRIIVCLETDAEGIALDMSNDIKVKTRTGASASASASASSVFYSPGLQS